MNAIKGRLFNVVGDAIDGIGEVSKDQSAPIHRKPPAYEEPVNREGSTVYWYQSNRPDRSLH